MFNIFVWREWSIEKIYWSMKKLSRFFSSIENIEINRRSNEKMRQILLNQSSKWFFDEKIVQLLHILHINQQSYMIFIYLINIVEQNQRIFTFQKLLKSIHYRNSFEIFKITFSSDSFLKIQFFAMFATFQCDFDHNSMRIRSIFDIIDYLNRAHFELQRKFSFVYYIQWMQMLLRCEIREIAKQWRNVEFNNLIKCNSNSEDVRENFF